MTVTLKITSQRMSSSTKSNYFDRGEYLSTGWLLRTSILFFSRGPLGLTISGSEDVFEPIVVSDLCEGGLADK